MAGGLNGVILWQLGEDPRAETDDLVLSKEFLEVGMPQLHLYI